MKVRLIFILALLSLTLCLLISCGGKNDDPATDDPDGDVTDGGDEPQEEIEIPNFSFSGIRFQSRSFGYDGTPHSLEIRGNLPDDVTVRYENNSHTNAGTYDVVAKFYYMDHYIEGKDKNATLVITKANFDVSSIRFNDLTVGYDGKSHSISIEGSLPAGLSVSYSGNGVSAKGAHTVTAVFSGDFNNYNSVADMTAILTVTDKMPAGVSLGELYTAFDGTAKHLTVQGTLPAGASVSYSGNGQRLPGDYTVTADFGNGYGVVSAVMHVLMPEVISADEDDTYGLVYEHCDDGYTVVGFAGDRDYALIPHTYKGEKVVSIGAEAFKDQTALALLFTTENLVNIGTKAFFGCTGLTEVVLADGLRSIGQRAFESTGLAEICLPDELVSIGFGSFRDTPLQTITLPFIGGSRGSSNKFLGYIFGAIGYVGNTEYVPDTLKTVILSDVCTEIPAYSFYACDSLEQVVIGNGVSYIGLCAFGNCESLKGLYIPSTVTEIYGDGYYYNGILFGCSADAVIATSGASAPSSAGAYWLCRSETERYTLRTGLTYDEFLALIS